jgi:hypothetical protein
MTTVFPSKVDRALGAVGFAMPCVALVAIITSPRLPALLRWLPLLALAGAAVLIVWVVLSTYYEFKGEALIAHCGPFFWRIPLQEISDVRESRSARSGPALSMDRLAITFGGGRIILVSPQDKAGFLAALRRTAPRLTGRADG